MIDALLNVAVFAGLVLSIIAFGVYVIISGTLTALASPKPWGMRSPIRPARARRRD